MVQVYLFLKPTLLCFLPFSTFYFKPHFACSKNSKKLISVHQFCRDNNVYFEFHDIYFPPKDYLGNILLRGNLKDNPYSLSTIKQHCCPYAFSSICLALICWHQRLGHASLPIVKIVISSSFIPVDENKKQCVQDVKWLKSILCRLEILHMCQLNLLS